MTKVPFGGEQPHLREDIVYLAGVDEPQGFIERDLPRPHVRFGAIPARHAIRKPRRQEDHPSSVVDRVRQREARHLLPVCRRDPGFLRQLAFRPFERVLIERNASSGDAPHVKRSSVYRCWPTSTTDPSASSATTPTATNFGWTTPYTPGSPSGLTTRSS